MSQAIQSTQNAQVKRLKALMTDPKARGEAGVFLIEGPKLASEALRAGVKVVQGVLAPGSGLRDQLLKLKVELVELGDKAFASVSGTESPQGVILVAQSLPLEMPAPKAVRLAVAVERLQDPGNLGTVLRSAWACAADAVYLSEGCADPFAPKVLRSAAGAQWHLKIEAQAPLAARLKALRQAGVQVLALDPHAPANLWSSNLKVPTCFVLGSEGQGLSRELHQSVSQTLKIEYPGLAESLNAGVCLSIALFEALRQTRK